MLIAILASWLGCEFAASLGVYVSPISGALYNNHFYAFPLLTFCVFFLASGPTRPQVWGVLGASAALATVIWGLKTRGILPDIQARDMDASLAISMCQAFGLACVVEMTFRARFSQGCARQRVLVHLLAASLIIGFALCGPFVMGLSTWVNPTTNDALAFAGDGSFGGQPSFIIGQWFESHQVLSFICLAIYSTNSLTFTFVYLLQIRQPKLPRVDIMPAIVLSAALIWPLYLLFPVCGPKGVFSEAFPESPPSVASVLATELRSPTGEASTSMPSLHTITVLLAWWHARKLHGWCRALAGTWLIGTVLATLGFGLHYVVDLVVAVPYALAIQSLIAPTIGWLSPLRLAALMLGGTLTASWLVMLRFHVDWLLVSPVCPISITVSTISVCFWLESRLYRKAWGAGDDLVR